MKTPEGYVKDDIDKHLKSLDRCYFFSPVQVGYGKRTLDRLCCIRGRFVGIEVKRLGKTPTKLQEDCAKEIVAAGGVSFWCDSFESYLVNMKLFGFIA